MKRGCPIDGFHLSSGYTSFENRRFVFTWNTTRFKDPRAYFAAMNEKGAQNVPNVKPGILLMHPWFDEFVKKDVFVKDPEGGSYSIGKWWGGDGAFWDFTKPEARQAWKEYLTEHVIDVGTNSIWDDNCEYDSLLDKDCRCRFRRRRSTMGQLKPLMSTLMCKIAGDAVREHDKDARPYVVCRRQRRDPEVCPDLVRGQLHDWKSSSTISRSSPVWACPGSPTRARISAALQVLHRRRNCLCAGYRTACSSPVFPSILPAMTTR